MLIVTMTWPTAKSGDICPLTTGNHRQDGDVPVMSQRHHQTFVTSLSLARLNGKVEKTVFIYYNVTCLGSNKVDI